MNIQNNHRKYLFVITLALLALTSLAALPQMMHSLVSRAAPLTGSVSALNQNTGEPLALAAGDFDEDGVPDVISGYAGADGSVTLQRGNVDALFPNSPAAQQRRAQGQFTAAPLLAAARVFTLPEAPELLAAGDFNADGHLDIVAAARDSQALQFLPGDGRGGFGAAQTIALPGRMTVLTSGEINQADGLADVVVGIAGAQGPQALIFEGPDGALKAQPESFALPSAAVALALGKLDDDPFYDLAVAAGNEVVLIKGRDRRLSLDAARQAEVEPASRSQRSFPFMIAALALGEFSPAHRLELMLLSEQGTLHLLSAAGPESSNQTTAKRAQPAFRSWRAEEIFSRARSLAAHTHPQLLAARLAGHAGDDLLIVAGGKQRLQVISNALTTQGHASQTDAATLFFSATAVEIEATPIAVLPLQLNGDALSDLVMLSSGQSTPTIALSAPAAIFTVTNTNDSGAGSLRDAITQANATAGADTINFASGSGLQTINLFSALPALNETVTIDGTTQLGFAGAPLIELRGTSAGFNTNGLVINVANCLIKGLVINGFAKSGVFISGAGASGNMVQGCYIGTNAAGTAAFPNGTSQTGFNVDGVDLVNGAHDNLIGGTTTAARNVISGNSGGNSDGIFIAFAGSNNNLIKGNYLGINAAGTAALANGLGGVEIATDVSPGPQGNIVGGTAAGAGNVASGNSEFGVGIFNADSNNNLVQGNFLGTNAAGTAAVPNGITGAEIANPPAVGASPKNNLIGGTTPSARNIISGNSGGDGVWIKNPGTNNNLVQGNYIGTDVTGTSAIPNGTFGGFNGIEIAYFASNNTVGGTASGARNLVSGNGGAGIGIFNFGTTSNIVQGNFIGTDVTGLSALSAGAPVSQGVAVSESAPQSKFGGQLGRLNGLRNSGLVSSTNAPAAPIANFFGMVVIFGSQGSIIGGTAPGAGNIIAFNSRAGVLIDSSTGNAVLGNSIFTNGGLGIDLGNGNGFNGENGVTPNDACDGDFGANNLQNFPVLTAAASGASTTIQGTLNSTGSTTFTLEFFANPVCDASGNGEGKTFIGSMPVTTNASCTASFNFTFPTAVPGGQSVTATATDPSGNTSEFSACRQVIQQCTFSIAPTAQTFTASGGSDMVAVTAPGGCNWTAVSSDSFITINSGSSGTGNGTVNYAVAANPTANPRSGTLTIAGQTFTVNQSGMTCAGLISPTSASFSAIGGTGNVMVPAPSGCNWTAASNDAWITVTSGTPGTGNGAVGYNVAVNPGGTRIGTLTIASQTFTITQTGGLMFFPLPQPVRLLETRAGFTGCTMPGAPINANGTLTLPARTTCAGIPANAAAVTGNITVVPSGPGFLTLFPSSATQPTVANSNFQTNEITNNVFTVGLGAGDGAFKIFSSATTHVIVDVTGYYAPPNTGGLYFHPLATPVRLLETRLGFTGCIATGTQLIGTGDPNADPNLDLLLQGRSPVAAPCNSIPATAQVLVGNATSVLPNGGGYLTIYPSGGTRPTVASSNYAGNDVINGPFAVKLGTDGKFKIYTFATTHLVVDILGYYSEDAVDANGAGLLFNPLPSPVRLLETRPDFPGFPLTGCTRTNAPITGNLAAATHTQMAANFCGLPAAAQAIVGNVSVVNSTGAGFLTLFPANLTTAPLVATSNYPVPATFGYNRHYFVGLSPADGKFKVLTQFTTDLILDASGYFAP